MTGFRITPLEPRRAGNLRGFGFTIEFPLSSALPPKPSADEESRAASSPGGAAPYSDQE